MGDGTKENPYTREDVLRLIQENGGTAKELDLSGKIFEKGIVLSNFHLEGALLRDVHLEEADLRSTHLEKADLSGAHLEKAMLLEAHLEGAYSLGPHLEGAILPYAHLEGAILSGAHLEGAYLFNAHLEGAYFSWANLKGAILADAEFSSDTNLENVHWGNYILGEERDDNFDQAADTYRRLKIWYTNAGLYDIAGKFFFREMTAKRKAMKWWPNPLNRAFAKLVSVLCGYGEKPERVVVSALAIIFGLAIAYHLGGSFDTPSFWDKLYYSVVSFTAVGYGNWAPQPVGWAKGMGAAEAFIGVFMMALFLVTFTRKMTR